MIDKDDLFTKLDSLGEITVREKLARGDFANHKVPLVQAWLRQREDERTAEAVLRSEAREEESLSISRKALAISEEANSISKDSNALSDKARRSARTANIIAIIALAITIIMAIIGYKYKTP